MGICVWVANHWVCATLISMRASRENVCFGIVGDLFFGFFLQVEFARQFGEIEK